MSKPMPSESRTMKRVVIVGGCFVGLNCARKLASYPGVRITLIDSVAVTVMSIIFFGWVLIFAGIVEAVQALLHRTGSHFFLHVLDAVYSFIVGMMLLRNSLASLLVITLLLAVYFVVTGIYRIVAALTMRVPGSGWMLVDGIITLMLGILVWAQWPMAARGSSACSSESTLLPSARKCSWPLPCCG